MERPLMPWEQRKLESRPSGSKKGFKAWEPMWKLALDHASGKIGLFCESLHSICGCVTNTRALQWRPKKPKK